MRSLIAAAAAAAVLGVGVAIEPHRARAGEPVTVPRAPGRNRKTKWQEERDLRALPVPPSVETRQQRRARERGYLRTDLR